jgi:hypothetical protein
MLSRLHPVLGVLTAVVAGVTVAGLIPAAAATAAPRPGDTAAPDATSACGTLCVNYFTQEHGSGYVLNDLGGRRVPGNPVTLQYASKTNVGEDWSIWPAGSVSQLVAFGILNRNLDLHYAKDQAFQAQYTPSGLGTGLCAGLASAAVNGEAVTLQPCFQSGRTIWISDAADRSGSYLPLINGSDTNFSDPQVLTAPAGPAPWPSSQLTSYRLQSFANRTVFDNQMWANTIGVLP